MRAAPAAVRSRCRGTRPSWTPACYRPHSRGRAPCTRRAHNGDGSFAPPRQLVARTRPVGWWAGAGSGRRVAPFLTPGTCRAVQGQPRPPSPHPRQRHKVTNWAEYDAALRQRGSLTVWFTEAAIAAWRAAPRTTPGGQPHYSALAIMTALTLRAVFRLALRQTEGLIGSIVRLLGLDLAIPDHSTLSRRAETLAVAGPPSSAEPVHLLVDSTGLNVWRRRMVGREARYEPAPVVAQTAHRCRCRHWPDRRGDVDHQ